MQNRLDQLGVLDFLKHLQMAEYEPKQIVFRQDDIGKDYFFIIEGSVFVMVTQQDETDN